MSGEPELEISMLLSVSFNGTGESELSKSDLARMWSLDMQWFTPDSASKLVERLLKSGWLVESEGFIFPSNATFDSQPPLGWRPLLGRIENIPGPPIRKSQVPPTSNEELSHEVKSQEVGRKTNAEHVPLSEILSEMSGLERDEVIRRAKRKRLALGPVSMRIAMLLLAREQNLDMEDLLEKSYN
tara:strand:+ start:341 stop:895 length:555 start_codon:yes stop_codon:yes gene_type:complete